MGSESIQRALQVVLLPDVWELVPDGGECPRRDGVISSPFRPDRNPSFSIYGGLSGWMDQSTGEKGGVWNFVQACRPEWSKQDVARYLVEKAGLPWDEPGKGGDRPKRKTASVMARERTERNHAARREFYAKRNAPVPSPSPLTPWPVWVRAQFLEWPVEGVRMERLASRRGWPVDWVDALVGMDVLRFPELPWNRKRFPAFTVGMPGTKPVGYHQRIWTPQDGPAWLFVPYRPTRPSNDFTRQLASHDGPRVPPLPFVLGDPSGSTLWCITEGQWDAITLWGALGGFEDQFDLPVSVFGLRGANAGPMVFFSHYQKQLRAQRPRVLLVPDNDPAGDAWDGSGWDVSQGIRPKTFLDHLIEMTGRAEIPIWRIPGNAGKDFNDLWKSDPPSRAELLDLIVEDFPGWPE